MPVLPVVFDPSPARENFQRAKTSSTTPPQNFPAADHYTREQIEDFILAQGLPAGVARVLSSLAMIESAGNPAAVGAAGEQGLFQVMPSTWQRVVRGSAPAGLSLADQWAWASPVIADVGGDVARVASALSLGSQDAARVFNLAWQFGFPRVEEWLRTGPAAIGAAAFVAWLRLPAKVAAAIVERERKFLSMLAGVGFGFAVLVAFLGLGLVLMLRKLR